MKLLFSLMTTLALISCSGESNLDEDFSLTNDSSYTLQITYKINPGELRASLSSNYDANGIFFGDKIYIVDIPSGETQTLFNTYIKKHATWHATGPAKPDDFFQYIEVEAMMNDNAVARVENLDFEFINHGASIQGNAQLDNAVYEYHATVTDEDLLFP